MEQDCEHQSHILRKTCESGKHYHHQPENTLDILSGSVAEKLTSAAYALASRIAQDNLDAFGIDPSTRERVNALWEAEYGGW